MSQPYRLARGGLVDRSQALDFTFDGASYQGYQGDTLASALLANGVRLLGRSFKYHRPRGLYSAGVEEMNALMSIGSGARAEPNTRATQVELYAGLTARSQNRWPSLKLDLMAVNNLFAPLFPAGFYYKTFMWPARWWRGYEKIIRQAAGLGVAPAVPDPDRYEKKHAHCDVLVVGAGPAGLAAALGACRKNLRVILVDERAEPGGSLLFDTRKIDGQAAPQWIHGVIDELRGSPRVRILTRCTAFGYYDHNTVALAERALSSEPVRQRLWHVRAANVVLAAGAIERPLVFGNNDLPGVMLAAAVRAYCNQYGVAAGKRVLLFTNNNHAYETAFDLAAAGVAVAAVVDSRAEVPAWLRERLSELCIPLHAQSTVQVALGRRSVSGARIAQANGGSLLVPCDVLAVSGGWAPSVHLHSQSGGKVIYDESIAAFIPGVAKQTAVSVGAAAGKFSLQTALQTGYAAGASGVPGMAGTPACDEELPYAIAPLWTVPLQSNDKAKRFVDIQDDVTVEDIALAARENFRSVEHLKRYTTLGMGTDQGKTSNINGLAIMADLRGDPITAVGTTTFRPPYTPVTLGLFAGRETGKRFAPTRLTPMHEWHIAQGATLATTGQWLRPKLYQHAGESYAQAWQRECRHVRAEAGLVDVSTLGKIDVKGPDAGEFLDRVYANNLASLAVGRARYGLMLREDGLVMDDGTVARLANHHYFMTTTTANAGAVMSHLEFLLATAWPDLRVRVTSVSDHFAQIALAGPSSRAVLQALLPQTDITNDALPHMGVLRTILDGVALNIFRVSYSGERAYELSIAAGYGLALWQRLLEVGAPYRLAPYGTEAMGALRIEKGHVAGPELDGRVTAADLGMGKLASKKRAFIGQRLLERPGLQAANRPSLVGLLPIGVDTPISAGAVLTESAKPGTETLGWVSSAVFSPSLNRHVALGFVASGRERIGQRMLAWSPLQGLEIPVEIVAPVFFDSEGERLHG